MSGKYVVVYQAGPDHKRRAFDTRVEAETFYRSTKGNAYVVTLPEEGGETDANGSKVRRGSRRGVATPTGRNRRTSA